MKVKNGYHVEKYGTDDGALMEYINIQKKWAKTIEHKILYKRAYTWVQSGFVSPEDKANIDKFINEIFDKFKRKFANGELSDFRIERKSKHKSLMTVDNIIFVEKGGRK